MWQKADPRGLRVWHTQKWPAEWFTTTQKDASTFFVEDVKVREFIEKFYHRVWIAKVVIRKTAKDWEILLFTAKPAAIIGRDGAKLAEFEAKVKKLTGKTFKVTVKEVKSPEMSAKIMAEFACMQLEGRISYRRVAKGVLQKVMEKGAIGVKIKVGWRLGWVDLSRSEAFTEGRIPLQTLRADIDYHYTTALTKYGILWVKVWICKSENTQIVTKKTSAMDRI